jgi:DNA-binding response OmpR family regulator
MAKKILVVDDDALMRRSLAASLTQAGYTTLTAASAQAALAAASDDQPDLILLDIGLPDVDGLEVLRRLRQSMPALPVIFVTARRRELDEIVGLELGADDYITKPFDMDVLLAHVRAVLRRAAGSSHSAPQRLVVGDLTIDAGAREARLDRHLVPLAPKEFDLLYAFAQQPGQVLSAEDLLQQVWGPEWIGESQTLYVHIRWLREKIEAEPAHPKRIVTIRGAGYKLVPQALPV